jgi:WD40 repeat protein
LHTLPMGSTSSPDPPTAPFESGMPRLALRSAILSDGHADGVGSVAYSPDGRRIISGSFDRTIRIWDAETGAAVGDPLKGHTNGCGPLLTLLMGDTSSPDPLTAPFESGMPRLALQSAILSEGHTDSVRSVAYSPDGRRIISGSDDCTIRIWDAETGASVGDPLSGHTTGCGPLLTLLMGGASSPDPTTAPFESGMPRLVLQSAILSRGTLARCGPLLTLLMGGASSPDPTTAPFESGMPRLVLQSAILSRGITDSVRSVAYSPDGRHIISGSDDHTIRIWDAETGAAVGDPLKGHTDWCGPLLTLLMGGTSSPDPTTAPFESGMPRLALQSAILSAGTLTRCGPLLTLPMGGESSPDPTTAPFESGMPRLVLRSAILSRGT